MGKKLQKQKKKEEEVYYLSETLGFTTSFLVFSTALLLRITKMSNNNEHILQIETIFAPKKKKIETIS